MANDTATDPFRQPTHENGGVFQMEPTMVSNRLQFYLCVATAFFETVQDADVAAVDQ